MRPSARRRLGPSKGAVSGAVVAVVLVAIVAALAFILIRRRRRLRSADLDPEPTVTGYYAHEHADPMPNRNGVVLSAPAQVNSPDNANYTIREAKLARLFPPASDKASSSDYTQIPRASSSTGVDAAIPELYAAMRDAGFTVHTLFDHLRQRPQDEAVQADEPHSETLPLYEDPRRRQ
ncbi:hypothetical protein EXIGLDRAFT_734274 [Exidia glandulosa HHB12029]|uniref:Uncharacterized protein n=1 Tax=Exidia glandulosa HHB12029 TaxID=1314781 RepID=A0A165Z6F6_EXIGL|nr:hypothetical protein EXIGLDRAFT_734274 [Exidia glandulosa HHB12029]